MEDGIAVPIPWDEIRKRRLLGKPARGEDALRCGRVRRVMLSMQRASWEQGVAAQAALEEGDWDLAILLAREAVLRQDAAGRLSQVFLQPPTDPGVVDAGAAGEAVIFAALAAGDQGLVQGAERMLGYFLHRAPRSADGVLFHLLPSPDGELWSDSFYMAPPFLALAGQPEEAMRQLRGLWRRLFLPSRRMLAHRWNESQGRFVRQAAWGVGNGWAAAGMARVIGHLPPAMGAEREELAERVGELLAGCLAHQRPDGLFHDVVDDPSTFVETNLAQMLAWTIYRGAVAGWLDRTFLERAEVMRRAVLGKVDASGFVRDVCGSPTFDRAGTAAEGQAFFLMMEAARREHVGQ
jgi:unsaturated rhamnogalacturonyl hydrolase